jgi:HAD superfamily hydrolase (TIGR01484 family)
VRILYEGYGRKIKKRRKMTARKVIAFDLDDTLAISKSPVDKAMGSLLVDLAKYYQICIITGGTYGQIKTQVIDKLPTQDEQILQQFHLMPTCGTRYYIFDGEWTMVYAEDLTDEQKAKAIEVLERTAKEEGIWVDQPYGPILEDRFSQITYSALGQEAPPEKKYEWKERNSEAKIRVRNKVQELLPDLEVRLGGSTSIDITRPGIDKAYGISKLIHILGLDKSEVLFYGDNLQEDGNDRPVLEMGIDSIAVTRWEDTAIALQSILQTK